MESADLRDGAHGQRLYDLAAVDIHPWRQPGCGHWLLAHRSITDPEQIAYYICYGPANTDLTELVRVAGARWAIEEYFHTAKNETGLDHHQVRRYQAWYRHITLSMAPVAFILITRDVTKKRGTGAESTPGLIPLIINEIRKLLNRVTAPFQHIVAHTLHWSYWRRSSQARARTSHYRRRGQNLLLQY